MLFMFIFASDRGHADIDIDEIIDAYAAMVKRCAYLCLGDEGMAEDICQEVFLKLWQALPLEGGRDGMKAWLIKVTLNASRDYLRTPWRRRIRPEPADMFAACEACAASPESDAMEAERNELLYDAIMTLPLRYRAPIILHYYFDYSQQETADMLAISDTALRSRLMRARRLLRDILHEYVEL